MEDQINFGNQNTQQVEQSPVNHRKPRINFNIVGVVVFLCFLIFGIGGFYLGKKSLSNKQSLEREQNQPSPSPMPVTDLSTNWKTCTNTKSGFSIKYPENFGVDTATCNYVIMDYNLVKDINIVNAFDDFRKNWLLTVNTEKYNQNVGQWIKDKDLCPSSFESCSSQVTGPILNSVEFDQLNRHYAGVHVIVKINGLTFDLSLSARNPNIPVSSEIRSLYHQILSTFKVFGQDPANQPDNLLSGIPTNWKRFNSNSLKISFSYPPDFTVIESNEALPQIGFEKGVILSLSNSPTKWSIGEYNNYDGGSRRLWYLNNHPEFSEEAKTNLKFIEYKTANLTGLHVSYVGTNYSWNDVLLIPRGKKMIVVMTNDLRFLSSIQFY